VTLPSLSREGVGTGFPFTEDETHRHFSYLSGTLKEFFLINKENYLQKKENGELGQ